MRLVTAFLFLFLPMMSLADDAPLAQPERDEFLPVANGRVAIPFVQSDTAVPVQTGATVEFVSVGGLRVREVLWETGFVLGSRDRVALIEVHPETAIGVALALNRLELRLRTKELPDPEVIALRLEHKDSEHGILLAPLLVSFTARVETSQEEINTRRPGQNLALGRDGEFVEVRFISATKIEDGIFEMTFAAREWTIEKAIALAATGPLRPRASEIEMDKKCFIVHRRGAERSRIQIPCTN